MDCVGKWCDTVRTDPTQQTNDKELVGEENAMTKAAETGWFDFRSAVGGKWRRDNRKGTAQRDAYDKLVGKEAKRAFMQEWAKRTYSSYHRGSLEEKKSEYAEIAELHQYTFPALVEKFGGWQYLAGVEGAKKHCAKCLALGPPWHEFNESTKLDFFRWGGQQHEKNHCEGMDDACGQVGKKVRR